MVQLCQLIETVKVLQKECLIKMLMGLGIIEKNEYIRCLYTD